MNDTYYTLKRHRRVKLVFNPSSGLAKESPRQLMDIIGQMQAWKLTPEVFLLEPDSDLPSMVRETLTQGITMFVACGGDGTVSAVSKAIAGMPVTLGIIPTGTRNNIALSLGIPNDIPSSIALLRNGRRIKIDLGLLRYGGTESLFMELCSVGLTSSVFPAADEIQHGHLEKIPELIAALIASSPSEIRLRVNGTALPPVSGYVVLVSNMPYAGRHYRLGGLRAFQDGLLDILFMGDLSKLDLLGYAIKKQDTRELRDPNVRHFQAGSVDIDTDPPMSIMADGLMLGEGPVHIEMKRRFLGVMTAQPTRKEAAEQ